MEAAVELSRAGFYTASALAAKRLAGRGRRGRMALIKPMPSTTPTRLPATFGSKFGACLSLVLAGFDRLRFGAALPLCG